MSIKTTCENEVWAVLFANQNNVTALKTLTSSQWVSASNFRETMDILQSCVFTLVACLYTALHLNVPDKRSWSSQLAEKVKSVVITLLAPEITLLSAAVQLLQAWQFKKAMIDLQTKSNDEEVKKYRITLTYAFFVAMGGLRIPTSRLTQLMSVDGSERPQDESFRQSTTILLTTHGTLKLAERGMWFYVSESIIKDKSKANTLQKSLVLGQVTWMLLQCVVRKACILPLTILELHTLVHIFCACLMYAFWWKKPLDVIEPEVRFEECWLNVFAVLVQAEFYEIPPPENENDEPSTNITGGLACTENRWSRVLEEFNAQVPKYDTPSGLVQAHCGGVIIRSQGMLPLLGKGPRGMLQHDLTTSMIFHANIIFEYWEPLFMEDPHKTPYSYLLAILLPALYGGIHMFAWNWTFPTNFELQNWRACCLFTAFGPVAAAFLVLPLVYLVLRLPSKPEGQPIRQYLFSNLAITFTFILGTILAIIWGCLQISYNYARLCIVVESFISLRLVPVGVYWTPMWLQVLPHA